MAATLRDKWNDSDVVGQSNANVNYTSQAFTPTEAYSTYSVKIKSVTATADIAVPMTVAIHAVDGSDHPTGAALASETRTPPPNWTGGGVPTWEEFVFGTPYDVSIGVTYAIKCTLPGTPSGTSVQIVGGYSGQFAHSASGSSWTDTAWSMKFEVWGEDLPATWEVEPILDGVGGFDISTTIERLVEPALPGTGGFSISATLDSIYNQGILMEPLPLTTTPHPNKGSDDDYDSQFASIKAYEILDRLLSTGTEDGADTFIRTTGTGLLRPPFEEQFWFDRAHLLPRTVQEFGNIVSAQVFDVELYNSDMDDTITISSVTNNLGSGISIVGVPSVPFNLTPRDNVEAVVTVSTVGSLTVDASYTFNQSTGETYTIYITGTRIVMFPIRPDAPLREHLIFDTKILTAVDGSEQRIANRKTPRSMFEMTITDKRRMMEMLLMDRQAKICATPAWHEPSFVSSAVSIGDYTVNVNTTDYANFYTGGYAIVLTDEYIYDALEIDSMNGTSLTFTTPVANAYAVQTQVMPLMVAYFNHSVSASKALYNEQVFDLQLKVDATDNDIADASAFNTYGGKVFLDGPNLVDGVTLQEVMEKKVLVLDNVTGIFQEFSQWDRSKRGSTKGFKTNDRQELWELRQLLHFLKGEQVSFYIPTFTKDLLPNTTLINANSTFTMDNISYTVSARDRAPKDFFRILLKDGTELTRTVVGSAEVSTAVEQLTVDAPWPYNIEPEDIERVDFLEKVRINVDDIVITHYNALGQSKTFLPIKEVFD